MNDITRPEIDWPQSDGKPGVEDIQQLILKRICFLDYVPGDRLKEAELAREFGVSRTPVRDAISRISHLGLVETLNGVGTVVVELSPEKIAEVYDVRLHLATLIGTSTPVRIEESHLTRLRALLREAQALDGETGTRQYVQINYRLHGLTRDLIGNSVLRSFWTQAFYQAASTWHRVVDTRADAAIDALINELLDLEAALMEGDIVAVGHIQYVHIGYGYKRIRMALFDDPMQEKRLDSDMSGSSRT